MLIIEADMMKACKAGANVAEVKQIKTRTVDLSNGQKEQRPVWGSVYLDGLPLGESSPEIKAPIALETGDTIKVVDDFPDRILFEVVRDGKVVWAEKVLHEEQAQREADKAAKLAAIRALQ